MAIPVGYLIPALIALLSVYYVLAPMSWPRPLRVLPMRGQHLGWWVIAAVVSELPLFALALLAASTILAVYQGDIYSPGGWAALGVNVAAAVGLLAVLFQSLKTAPAIRRALHEALGHEWSTRLDSNLVARLNARIPAKALSGPCFVRGGPVRHIRNIEYGSGRTHQALDLYLNRTEPRGGPVFIHLHGGALRSGRKDHDALPLLYHLATHGWVGISANYRLQPDVTFNEQLADVRCIVAWTKQHVAEFGGDPGFVMLGGGSSGAQLAAMIGLESNSVDAVLGFYGTFQFGSHEESPISHINRDAPPFLLMHGTHDNLVPVEGARRFAEQLRRVSANPVVYLELPNADHNFDLFNSVRSLASAHAVEAFGAWARESKRQPSTAPAA